jgi:hypothetical protein
MLMVERRTLGALTALGLALLMAILDPLSGGTGSTESVPPSTPGRAMATQVPALHNDSEWAPARDRYSDGAERVRRGVNQQLQRPERTSHDRVPEFPAAISDRPDAPRRGLARAGVARSARPATATAAAY